MNKLSKIVSVIVLMIIMISMSITVNAYTNNDVISYVTKAHTVNGRTVQLSKSQRQSLTKYLQENPVTDSEANEIIAKLEEAKAKIVNSGATNLSQLSDSVKAEVLSLVKSAGKIAGLDVQVDTVNETVTVKDSNGNVIISATSYKQFNTNPTSNNNGSNKPGKPSISNVKKENGEKLVYTGNDYSVIIKTIVAIVAIAIVGIVSKNKYAK